MCIASLLIFLGYNLVQRLLKINYNINTIQLNMQMSNKLELNIREAIKIFKSRNHLLN